jgi:hypothetical protein
MKNIIFAVIAIFTVMLVAFKSASEANGKGVISVQTEPIHGDNIEWDETMKFWKSSNRLDYRVDTTYNNLFDSLYLLGSQLAAVETTANNAETSALGAWKIGGNTVGASSYLGTNSSQNLVIGANNVSNLTLFPNANANFTGLVEVAKVAANTTVNTLTLRNNGGGGTDAASVLFQVGNAAAGSGVRIKGTRSTASYLYDFVVEMSTSSSGVPVEKFRFLNNGRLKITALEGTSTRIVGVNSDGELVTSTSPIFASMTGVQATNLIPEEGMIIRTSSNWEDFQGTGFWFYENGHWAKFRNKKRKSWNKDFPSTPAHTSTSEKVYFEGAEITDHVFIVPPLAGRNDGFWDGWVSDVDSVLIRFVNPTTTAIDPPNVSLRVYIEKD